MPGSRLDDGRPTPRRLSVLADSYLRSGKVRDLYTLDDGRLVLVASDRMSAFDVVLPTAIPDKGRILTGLSRFWFGQTAGVVPNHLLGTDPEDISPAALAGADDGDVRPLDVAPLDELRGRIMICRPALVLPIEAVVRGYLAGSGWHEYRETGRICGVSLPAGLREGDRLPEPIFTPATKAELGAHDENISFDGMIDHLDAGGWAWPNRAGGGRLAERIRALAIRLYGYGAAVCERSGILLADTKFEFGLVGSTVVAADTSRAGEGPGDPTQTVAMRVEAPYEDHLVLIDEVMTPDSSRFWDAARYAPGGPQQSFDKQYLRDWLTARRWNKMAPGPELPPEVVEGTRRRYIEAFERITGASFERYLAEDVIAP